MNLELWILVRVAVAEALGGLIGYERETVGKEAGLRTLMLVAMGAALFLSCNDLALELATRQTGGPDALRIQVTLVSPVEAVATGVGFLGAGVIFVGRGTGQVQGLTTAASIWIVAAIGLAVGFDRYLLATGATGITLVVLRILVRYEHPSPPSGCEETPKRNTVAQSSADESQQTQRPGPQSVE